MPPALPGVTSLPSQTTLPGSEICLVANPPHFFAILFPFLLGPWEKTPFFPYPKFLHLRLRILGPSGNLVSLPLFPLGPSKNLQNPVQGSQSSGNSRWPLSAVIFGLDPQLPHHLYTQQGCMRGLRGVFSLSGFFFVPTPGVPATDLLLPASCMPPASLRAPPHFLWRPCPGYCLGVHR